MDSEGAGDLATEPAVAVLGQFSLVEIERTPGCARCSGLATVEVQCAAGTVGRFVAEHPWYLDIPEDPKDHPSQAHYRVDWVARDVDGNLIPEIGSPNLYFGAVQMMTLAQQGRIATAVRTAKSKG